MRIFVSIPVPDTPELFALRRDLAEAGARVSPPEQTHITLKFVGETDRVKVVEDCVSRSVEGTDPFTVTLSGLGAFPNIRNPSVVWVGASPSDVLTDISLRIGKQFDDCHIRYDGKPFRAHATVARCRNGVRKDVFDRYGNETFCGFECDRVCVMGSVLTDRGAVHRVVREIEL